MFFVFGVLTFLLWAVSVFLGAWHTIAKEIEEWKGTIKPILWTFAWGLVFSTMFAVYIIASVIIETHLSWDGYLIYGTAWIIAMLYIVWFVGVPIYWPISHRLKKKYGLIFQSDITKIQMQNKDNPDWWGHGKDWQEIKRIILNDPEFRNKILGLSKTQSGHPHGGGDGANPAPLQERVLSENRANRVGDHAIPPKKSLSDIPAETDNTPLFRDKEESANPWDKY